MKINRIDHTAATEIKKDDGTIVLVSYSTPVAAYIPDRGYIRTSENYSVTTTRHINRFLSGSPAATVAQAEIDALL